MRMALIYIGLVLAMIIIHDLGGWSEDREIPMQYNTLTPEERRIIEQKGTEPPGTGEYLHTTEDGIYTCRRCNAPLYRSKDKFDSGCGWPAFDDEIPGSIRRHLDADGRRVEILCAACGGHLGHVFEGERLTPKNTRHCVNSLSMKFKPTAVSAQQTAYFAAGCFWGVEYWFKKEPGVLKTEVGYMGGILDNPTYRQVCGGDTGHAEVLKVTFDPKTTSFDTLCRLFLEIHDFTQTDGQGPDLGDQYRSGIFAVDAEQAAVANRLLNDLKGKGFDPATEVTMGGVFWPAEEYHQDYYAKTGKTPYCHARRKVFD